MRKSDGTAALRFEVRFSFLAVLGFLICTDENGVSLMCAGACILHELGHLAVMYAQKRPPYAIVLYGGGMHIRGGSTSFLCASAGIAVNLVLFLLFGLIPWGSGGVRLFGAVNLLIAAFNLIPAGELDGKLMLDKALILAFSPVTAARISDILGKLIFLLMIPSVILLVFSGLLNFSAIIFLIYILSVEILEKI